MNTFIIIDGIRINTGNITYYLKDSYTYYHTKIPFLIRIYFCSGNPVTLVAKTEEEQNKILQKLDEYLMVNQI